jgi:hypothetical protein
MAVKKPVLFLHQPVSAESASAPLNHAHLSDQHLPPPSRTIPAPTANLPTPSPSRAAVPSRSPRLGSAMSSLLVSSHAASPSGLPASAAMPAPHTAHEVGPRRLPVASASAAHLLAGTRQGQRTAKSATPLHMASPLVVVTAGAAEEPQVRDCRSQSTIDNQSEVRTLTCLMNADCTKSLRWPHVYNE